MKSEEQPLVSIIFLNFNGLNFVQQWQSLFKLDYSNYEIIFVDNGSNDHSDTAFIKMAYENPHVSVRILKLEKNCGYSMANNIGVKEAQGKYIVLLSNDIKVTEDWLRTAVLELESNKRIGVAQSTMFQLDNPLKHDPMGNYIDVFGLNHPYSFSGETNEVFYCEGAVMFIRREALNEALSLFDESYFMFYEDIDFSWRVRLLGYIAVVLPKSIVFHKRGGTVSGTLMKVDPKYVFTNTRNRLNTLLKNYSAESVLKFIPVSIAIEILKGVSLVTIQKVSAGQACFNGVLAFLREIRGTMKKRAIIQKRRRTSDNEIRRLMITPKESLSNMIVNLKSLRNEWKKR